MEKVGQLSILLAERLGTGRFGSVFQGKFTNVAEEVAIKKMEKKKVQVDSSFYIKANGYPNIIGYYGTETMDGNEFM